MTLLIASATHNCQILVADRQLTRVGRKPTIAEHEAYKIFNYVNFGQDYQCGIAFTGLASAGSFSTIDWLMKALPRTMNSDTDIAHGITALEAACTSEFMQATASVPLKSRGLTIILCGRFNLYGGRGTGTKFIPFLAIISNSMNSAGRQVDVVDRKFHTVSTRVFRKSASISVCRGDLATAGRHVAELRRMFRLFRRPINYRAKVQLGADFIRRVAHQSAWVGQKVLGLALTDPRTSEGFDIVMQTGKRTMTMPHFVSDCGMRATNYNVKPL